MNIRSLLLLIPFLLFSYTLNGQNIEGTYLKIDYLTVAPDHVDSFLGYVQTTFKNATNERIEQGELNSWKLYRVQYSVHRGEGYNYVFIISADSISAFDNIRDRSQDEQAMGGQSPDLTSFPEHVDFFSELWRVRNSVVGEDRVSPSRYILIDYMDVGLGREYEYQMFEDEIIRPLHEMRMDLDRMNAWEVYQLIIPGGLAYSYNFATGNYFNKLKHIEFGFTEELIRAHHPEVDMMDFFQTIYSTRDLVQSELWELIDYVN